MIEVRVGDLASVRADALVRPVRSDGESITAVGRRLEVAAGPAVGSRLQDMGDLPVGGAVITPGGELPTPFLIHTVLQSPEEPVTAPGVRRALVNALRRASEFGIRLLALPPVGVGPGNLDAQEAARILGEVLAEHRQGGEEPRNLLIVVESDYEHQVFGRLASAEEPSSPEA